jgi:hypothetical protein
MDELKDFMDIRIVTRCPMCGKRFKKLSIELNDNEPVWINSQCDCGLSLEIDETNLDYTKQGEALSKFNRVVSK